MTISVLSSRGVFGYACGALAGVVSAFTLSFALTHAGSVLVLFAYLAAVPLFLSGFGAGAIAGLIASAFGTLSLFATSPSSFGMFYLLADAIPAVCLISLAMRHRAGLDGKTIWGGEGRLLTALATYPCMIFLGVYMATMGHEGGLLALTIDAFNGMTDQVNEMLVQNGQTVTPEMMLKIHGYFAVAARVTPALMMCAWLFSTLIAMGLAQSALQQKGWNLRPAFALSRLQVPNWVIFAAAITGLAGAFAPAPYDYIGVNLALVLGLPFFFVGLAIVHAWANTTRMPTAALCAFYVLISIVPHLVLLVALLGAVDQWVDFRKRIASETNNQGG